MTAAEFNLSIKNPAPPENISPLLKSLWYDAKGDWEKAHETAQDIDSKEGSWIHAYLHRKEGDLSNASYWYSRAGRIMPSVTHKEEWEIILAELIETNGNQDQKT
jgi:hypothetical protein